MKKLKTAKEASVAPKVERDAVQKGEPRSDEREPMESVKIENVSFSDQKRRKSDSPVSQKEKPKRKEINLSELKKALDASLENADKEVEEEVVEQIPKKDEDEKPMGGVIEPGQKVKL